MPAIRRFCLCFVLLYLIPGLVTARVVDWSEVSFPPGIRALPDVCGKVNVDDALLLGSTPLDRGPVVAYPDWPQLESGSSDRGGIYCNLDADPELELVYCSSNRVFAWNIDATDVPGWPLYVTGYPFGAPAYGDIDGDGIGDIVVSTRIGAGNDGRLYAFEADGTVKSGFPVTTTGGATKTPTLGDLDADGALEIVIEERAYPTGYVCVYSGDGSVYPGWPQELDYVPGSAAAVGDITGDGVPEIIAESYYHLYAYDTAGNLLSGFPVSPGSGRVFSYSTPVLADMDGDGVREILCGDHSSGAGNGAVHVIRNDGTPLPGWPRYVSYWIYGPVAVGDIDGDGNPDVAVGDQVLAGSPVNMVYGWDATGANLTGFPITSLWAVNSQIILVDLDGDDQVELMFDDNTGNNRYMGYNHDGTPMAGWPLPMQGSSFFNNPLAVDINQDGGLDLSGAGGVSTTSTYFYLWDANAPVNPAKSYLPILQYNVRHDGVYNPPGTAGIAVELAAPRRQLGHAAPNPFSRDTAISLALGGDADASVRLAIYNVHGRRVRTLLAAEITGAGDRTVTWDGRDDRGNAQAAGVYWWSLQVGDQVTTRSVVLAR